jgi:hypothetical protein
MQAILNRILLAMSAAIVVLDTTWLVAGRFSYDARNYGLLVLILLPLLAAGLYYGLVRRDEALSAVLSCSAFLIVFPAGCSLLSYLLITISGPRIDGLLANADLAIGFHWPALMAFVASYPVANLILKLAYLSVMPQSVALLFVLGFTQRIDELYRLSLALTIGAVITLVVWTIAPSFGAFSVYVLPDPVAAKLGLVLGFDYGHYLVQMLKDGPGYISPRELRGIVGFPSYHTLQALAGMWYARRLTLLRWPAILLNVVVLVAIPVHGGHHLVDMFGGVVVTIAAIALAARIVAFAERRAASLPRITEVGAVEPIAVIGR